MLKTEENEHGDTQCRPTTGRSILVEKVKFDQQVWSTCTTPQCGLSSSVFAGPSDCNDHLPDHLQDPTVDCKQFMRDLKTYLFAGHSKR